MKSRVVNMNKSGIIVGIVALTLISACAAQRMNLAREGVVTVDIVPSQGWVSISRASVYEEEGNLLITGNVKTSRVPPLPGPGHVDVAIVNRDGDLLESLSVKPVGFRHKRAYQPGFSARLAVVPPRGSVIRLAYHSLDDRMKDKAFDCDQNAAVPASRASLQQKSSV